MRAARRGAGRIAARHRCYTIEPCSRGFGCGAVRERGLELIFWGGGFFVHNVIIIGSGCAGLTAAIYAARANLKPLVIDGHEPGGQLSLTTMVENFPGFPDGILGPGADRKYAQAGAALWRGVSRRRGDRGGPEPAPVQDRAAKETFEAQTLIVAAGASARMLGLESERKLLGHGVSTCATCDGFFFRGKEIAVVGGGDTAMEEAIFLTRFASRVHLIHRRNEFRASKIMLDRARANEKIHFITPAIVDEVLDVAKGAVEGVRLRNTGHRRNLGTAGATAFSWPSGTIPTPRSFAGKLDMDANGYLITHDGSRTNVAGVFAAGDVQDHHYRQAITAAGSGCMAAMDAEKFLEAQMQQRISSRR